MGVVIQLVVPIATYKVYAVGSEVEVFLREQRRRSPKEAAKLQALLAYSAQYGQPINEEKCRLLGDGLFEFKANSLRLLWFWDSDCMILCTNGFAKKRQKTPPTEIERARAIRSSYQAAKRSGRLTIKE